MKQEDTADFFISGYDPPAVDYKGDNLEAWPFWKDINGVLRPVSKYYYMDWIGSLRLSAYVKGVATYVCSCSGMDEAVRDMISSSRGQYINSVVKTSFMETTEANIPRHPRFEGFHESKQAHECVWELN